MNIYLVRAVIAASLLCCYGCVQVTTSGDLIKLSNQEIIYAVADADDSGTVEWVDALTTRIPPREHDLGDRWPLMLWRVLQPEEITKEVVNALLSRGLVPALPFAEESLAAALVIQRSGAPVILTEGKGVQWPGRVWPYNLVKDKTKWAYEYPDDVAIPESWKSTPIPTLFAGWSVAAAEIKRLATLFKENNVHIDAVWLDYEGEPRFADYQAAVSSTNGAKYLPRVALQNKENFARYTRQLWTQLLSAYVAGPIREIYPNVSVTNWVATLSLPELPVVRWNNVPVPSLGPTLFTATNPVAYGVDVAFIQLAQSNPITTQSQVDRLYTSILLRHVSADSYARQRIAPELESIVWVARWVPDTPSVETPMMSRPAYREALRHLWLRGASAMQIFSPVRKGFSELAIQEVEDVAAVFDEMLAYKTLMNLGEVLNFDFELTQDTSVLWSGMRFHDQAVIRAFSLRPHAQEFSVSPWPETSINLRASPNGVTYKLIYNHDDKSIQILSE